MQGDIITDTLSTGLAPVTFTSEEVLHRMHFILRGWDGKPVATGGHQDDRWGGLGGGFLARPALNRL